MATVQYVCSLISTRKSKIVEQFPVFNVYVFLEQGPILTEKLKKPLQRQFFINLKTD